MAIASASWRAEGEVRKGSGVWSETET